MRPTELALTLATLPGPYSLSDGWVFADEVRGKLRLLGFEVSAQQVAAWLGTMGRAESPWIESQPYPHNPRYREYRVTRQAVADDTELHIRYVPE